MRHKFNSEASQNRWDDQQEERDDRLLQLKMKELEVLSTVSQKRVPKSDLVYYVYPLRIVSEPCLRQSWVT